MLSDLKKFRLTNIKNIKMENLKKVGMERRFWIDSWTFQSWTLQKRFWILKSSFSIRWAGYSTYWIWRWRWSVLRRKWIYKWNWDWDTFNKISNWINAKLKNLKRSNEVRFLSRQLFKSNFWRNKSEFFESGSQIIGPYNEE